VLPFLPGYGEQLRLPHQTCQEMLRSRNSSKLQFSNLLDSIKADAQATPDVELPKLAREKAAEIPGLAVDKYREGAGPWARNIAKRKP
jgi:hypothetical protein